MWLEVCAYLLRGALIIDNFCSVVYEADLDSTDRESGLEVSSFSVGPRTVSPVWEDVPAQIRLDPSVIFGSGFHPTTRLCLDSLVELLAMINRSRALYMAWGVWVLRNKK